VAVYHVEDYEKIPAGLYEGLFRETVEKYSFSTNDKGEEERRHYYQWVFKIVNDEEFSGRRLFANVSDKFGPRSKARQWVESMTGRTFKAGEKFDTDELLDEVYHITVNNVEKNGNTYPEITSVNKVRQRKPKEQQAGEQNSEANEVPIEVPF
jgi:hypothetical protein